MFFQNAPIRRKLMTMFLITSGAVAALTAGMYAVYDFVTFRRATVAQMATLGEVIASNATAALAFDSREDAEQILGALRANRHIIAAGLYGQSGELFAHYPADLPSKALPVRVEFEGHRLQGESLVSVQPVIQNGKRLGLLFLRADLGPVVRERLRLHGSAAALMMLAALGFTFVISRVLQRKISQPILGLAETARAISERQDYSVRAVKQSADEVGELTDAFNRMLSQIQKLNRELEQRVVERTAELQAANQELEAFSYSVSHDLRAPVRHINGFAAMLAKHANATLDEKGRRYLSVIQESAIGMGQLIDDLLQFSRIGRSQLRRENVSLAEVIEEARRTTESDAGDRDVRWQVAVLPTVRGDPSLLRQVFVNLLSNALKYSRGREQTRIEIGVGQNQPGEVVVFVRDNGAGFDMKYADKLFGVFQRLHDAGQFEGTGVGLATAKRIVQRHGGNIWAEAKVNEGATFFVSLPLAETTLTNAGVPEPTIV